MASRSRRRNVLLALVSAVAFVAAASNAIVLRGGSARVASVEGVAPAPVIIVLGAGIHRDGTPTEILEDRLATAVDLYRLGRASRVLCSGDHGRASHDETGVMSRWLEDHGVPPEAIFLDHAGFDSWNTVVRARRVFGVTRAIFVTQAYHLPRVLWTAEHEGIDAQGVAADRHDYPAMVWYQAREVISRTKAALDVLDGRGARVLGPTIDLEGDGRSTR